MDKGPVLKVLHIASGDNWAGAEVQLYTLVRTLNTDTNISVVVVLLNHGALERKLSTAGIKVIVIDEVKLGGLQILYRLIHTIREQSPHIVHTHRYKENILGSIAALLAGSIPSLRTVHGDVEQSPQLLRTSQRIVRFIDRLCGRLIQQRIIAVSEDLAAILQQSFPPAKIRVIKNGIVFEETRNQQAARKIVDSEDDTPFRVGLAGRLVSVKRVDLFIQAARYTLDHCPDIKPSFHIYGDGPMLEELEKLSVELETTDIVHFEGHCDDILMRLEGLDALIMTSDHEGLPMILLEAMALEVPVIAHAAGGIPELLGQGCGILVHDHHASAYASALCSLAKSPPTQSEISQKALARVSADYTAENNAQKTASEYARICNRQ